jgi:hypothetical protein
VVDSGQLHGTLLYDVGQSRARAWRSIPAYGRLCTGLYSQATWSFGGTAPRERSGMLSSTRWSCSTKRPIEPPGISMVMSKRSEDKHVGKDLTISSCSWNCDTATANVSWISHIYQLTFGSQRQTAYTSDRPGLAVFSELLPSFVGDGDEGISQD